MYHHMGVKGASIRVGGTYHLVQGILPHQLMNDAGLCCVLAGQ